MKRNLLITALTFTLAMGTVSCSSSDSSSIDESTNETTTEDTTGDEYADIRSQDFYSADVAEDETAAIPFVTMIENIKNGETGEFNQLDAPVSGDVVATIVTSEGDIKVKLLPEVAPKAVKNFVEHALTDYYDGVTFHRIIDGFMIQGGDPTATGAGGESIYGEEFANELSPNARHFSGALAMANAGGYATNGSQFYIVDDVPLSDAQIEEFNSITENPDTAVFSKDDEALVDVLDEDVTMGELFPTEVVEGYLENGGVPSLDFGYTVFGQVYEGMDVVDAISQVETDENDGPVEDVVIEDVVVEIVE